MPASTGDEATGKAVPEEGVDVGWTGIGVEGRVSRLHAIEADTMSIAARPATNHPTSAASLTRDGSDECRHCSIRCCEYR